VRLATITLAIQDSVLPITTKRDTAALDVAQARRWLALPSADLHAVLGYAEILPSWWHGTCVLAQRRKRALADAGMGPPRRRGRQPAREARQGAIRPRGAYIPDSLTPGSALLGHCRRLQRLPWDGPRCPHEARQDAIGRWLVSVAPEPGSAFHGRPRDACPVMPDNRRYEGHLYPSLR
jgi:hypothetical protein